ncbi:MAG: glycosyltransferase [Candidatus Eremiobacteraeota bacterium]|nr:glycosyltransferase [Candidatus Eremiobacteraeota bacterium]
MLPRDFPSDAEPASGIWVLRQLEALRELGHEMHVIRIVPHAPPLGAKWAKYRSIPTRYEYHGIAVTTVRAIYAPRMIGAEYLYLQVARAVAREARRIGADLIHAHALLPEGRVAVEQSLPTVVTAHGSDAYDLPWRRAGLMRGARTAVADASRVVAVSDFIRQQVLRLSNRDVSVIYNGADETVFRPRNRAEVRNALDLPQDRKIIAFIGRIFDAKGIFELLEAMRQIAHLRPILLLAGIGPHRQRAETFAREAGVDVRFLGLLDSPHVADVLAASDVMALPSYYEGMPVVVSEAMLSGRAVVATPVGGVPEVVRDGETGMIVPFRDAGALAQRLAAVLENDDLRARLEHAAADIARSRLTWRYNARAHDELYRALLAG